jgi:alpha-glucuronidase
MRATWRSLQDRVDSERFTEVDAFLSIQEREGTWWRDASIAYFQSVSGRPLPPDVRPPEYPLDHYKSLRFVNVPGDPE